MVLALYNTLEYRQKRKFSPLFACLLCSGSEFEGGKCDFLVNWERDKEAVSPLLVDLKMDVAQIFCFIGCTSYIKRVTFF